ncbi:hypothetical protein FA95DRAFT_1596330, partial [Auriscalpium vulgare]
MLAKPDTVEILRIKVPHVFPNGPRRPRRRRHPQSSAKMSAPTSPLSGSPPLPNAPRIASSSTDGEQSLPGLTESSGLSSQGMPNEGSAYGSSTSSRRQVTQDLEEIDANEGKEGNEAEADDAHNAHGADDAPDADDTPDAADTEEVPDADDTPDAHDSDGAQTAETNQRQDPVDERVQGELTLEQRESAVTERMAGIIRKEVRLAVQRKDWKEQAKPNATRDADSEHNVRTDDCIREHLVRWEARLVRWEEQLDIDRAEWTKRMDNLDAAREAAYKDRLDFIVLRERAVVLKEQAVLLREQAVRAQQEKM